MSTPFSEDFLGTIVNVGWGTGDILWINATVAGNYTVTAGASDITGFMLSSADFQPINYVSLEGAIGGQVAANSGKSNGEVWCYPPHSDVVTTVGPTPAPAVIVDTANVTMFHAGIPGFDGVQVLGTITLFVDYNDPVSVRHAQQEADQLAVQAGSRLFNNGYVLFTILSSHLAPAGAPSKHVHRAIATNTFINLARVRAALKGAKTFTFSVKAAASFMAAEGGANAFGVDVMTWGKRQATKAVPFSTIKRFPVFADGTLDDGSFVVQPIARVTRTIDTVRLGTQSFTVDFETLAITA